MKIQDNFLAGFDELNILYASSYADSKDASEFIGDIESFLLTTYAKASKATDDDIDELHELDVTRMFQVLDEKIEGKTYADRLAEYYNANDTESIKKVLETEYHRVFNQSVIDTASRSEKELFKTWRTMEDDRVRETHFYLQDMKIPFNDEFITIDGDSALAPALFSKPENNIGCRCVLDITDK